MFQGQEAADRRTLNSEPEATLCANTTRWANLMQQILTEGAALSHIRNIFCLMLIILSQVTVSYPLLMLQTT